MSEIKNNLHAYHIDKIVFNKSEIKDICWKDQGKELEYKGKRYDIFKKIEQDSSLIIYCIEDKKETALFSFLDEHIKSNVISNIPGKEKSAKDISSKVLKLYFNTERMALFTQLKEVTIHSFYNAIYYKSPCLSEEGPPPDPFSA